MNMAAAAHKVDIVDYLPEHGRAVAAGMRESDRREIYYMTTLEPLSAVLLTVSHAVAVWTCMVDGEPAAIFGITRRSRLSTVGVPWLLSTDRLNRVPMAVMRRSKVYFDRMMRAFPVMENHVLAENTSTVGWLKWLGFDMEEPRPYGAFGAAFIRFGKGLDKCA